MLLVVVVLCVVYGVVVRRSTPAIELIQRVQSTVERRSVGRLIGVRTLQLGDEEALVDLVEPTAGE